MATAKTQDYTKMMQDMMGSFPMDLSSMQDSFKTYAAFGNKMSKVALEAADKSTEISTKWTKDTLSKLGNVTAVKEDPSEYSRALTDFASAQAETTAESLAAFAEVAKKVQMETVELMLAAGKDISEDMTAAAKKATNDVTAAARKASATAAQAK
ncbi:MAG: phasin family protein [Tranquillimonas sp.]